METEKPKNAKKEFIAILCIGITLIILATTSLLVFYRPFVNWKKFDFENNKDGVAVFDRKNLSKSTYYYSLDGVEYCKVYGGVAGAHYSNTEDKNRYILYVNLDNPNDVKRGVFGASLLTIALVFISGGGLTVWFGFRQKKCIEKEQGKYKKKK